MNRSTSTRALVAGAAVLVCLAAIMGCSSPRRSEPITAPMVLSDPNLLRGRLLFDRHCYKCHLQGEGGMSPALNNKPIPKLVVRSQVRLGLGTMPGFSREQLSDEDLDSLVDYVSYLRQHRAARQPAG